jgi:hypothetical protein
MKSAASELTGPHGAESDAKQYGIELDAGGHAGHARLAAAGCNLRRSTMNGGDAATTGQSDCAAAQTFVTKLS